MTEMQVTYLNHMGDDLMVANAARVSFDKQSEWQLRSAGLPDGSLIHKKVLSQSDVNLINFLARGMQSADFEKFVDGLYHLGKDILIGDFSEKEEAEAVSEFKKQLWKWRDQPTHWAPFAHPQLSFRIKAPIFVARQLFKHKVGFVDSEVSRRYIDSDPEFYEPKAWRKRAANVKQGSSTETIDDDFLISGHHLYCLNYYKRLLKEGVCPEQARMVLPQSMMTTWVRTGSLVAWTNMCSQRLDSHAQEEDREIILPIYTKLLELFPVSTQALIHP